MRGSVRTLLVVAALGGALGGCSRRPAESDRETDRELAVLVERARGIRAKLAADSSARAGLEPEWRRLVEDVEAWQARTGRNDIRTGTDSVRTPAKGTAARDNGGGGEGDECEDCKGYTVEGDRICFLVSEGSCPGPDDASDLTIGRVCVYECIWIGSGSEPEGQRATGKK